MRIHRKSAAQRAIKYRGLDGVREQRRLHPRLPPPPPPPSRPTTPTPENAPFIFRDSVGGGRDMINAIHRRIKPPKMQHATALSCLCVSMLVVCTREVSRGESTTGRASVREGTRQHLLQVRPQQGHIERRGSGWQRRRHPGPRAAPKRRRLQPIPRAYQCKSARFLAI
jgi:hypothetical protein